MRTRNMTLIFSTVTNALRCSALRMRVAAPFSRKSTPSLPYRRQPNCLQASKAVICKEPGSKISAVSGQPQFAGEIRETEPAPAAHAA